jgi:hypothetical protein
MTRVGPHRSYDGIAADPVGVQRQETSSSTIRGLKRPLTSTPPPSTTPRATPTPAPTKSGPPRATPTSTSPAALRPAQVSARVAAPRCHEHGGTPQDGQRPPRATRLIHSAGAVRGCHVGSAATDRPAARRQQPEPVAPSWPTLLPRVMMGRVLGQRSCAFAASGTPVRQLADPVCPGAVKEPDPTSIVGVKLGTVRSSFGPVHPGWRSNVDTSEINNQGLI